MGRWTEPPPTQGRGREQDRRVFKLAVTSFAVTVASKLRVAGADTHDMPIYLRTRIRERWPIDHPRLATRNRSAVPVAPPGFDLAQGRLHERVVSVERRHLIEAQETTGRALSYR